MAFAQPLYRFDEAKEIRNRVLTPVEMEALRPTEQDIAQEAETQDSQNEPMVGPVGSDQGYLDAIWREHREPDKRALAAAAGISQARTDSATAVIPGKVGSRSKRVAGKNLEYPNGAKAKKRMQSR